MSLSKEVIMQKVQRFGGAMFTPVLMFGVFGIFVAISILCLNPMILGSIAEPGTGWSNFWYIVQEGAWTVFRQMPLLFAIALPIGLAKKENARACCSDPIKLDLIIRVVIYCPDIFMPRNA